MSVDIGKLQGGVRADDGERAISARAVEHTPGEAFRGGQLPVLALRPGTVLHQPHVPVRVVEPLHQLGERRVLLPGEEIPGEDEEQLIVLPGGAGLRGERAALLESGAGDEGRRRAAS
jgi:hypothetical protein